MMNAETLEAIERRALEITAKLDATAHTLNAEIDPSVSPAWYVIITSPDGEALALKHLQRRGFGLFDPMFDDWEVSRGRKRVKRSRLLPGYLLAFVWDIDAQWPRMADCPGVSDILRLAGTQTAFVIQDQVVNYLQGLEISRSLNNTEPGWAGCESRAAIRKQKRYGRKNGSRVRAPIEATIEPAVNEDDIVIRCKSYLGGITGLAPAERICAFTKAIGLAL